MVWVAGAVLRRVAFHDAVRVVVVVVLVMEEMLMVVLLRVVIVFVVPGVVIVFVVAVVLIFLISIQERWVVFFKAFKSVSCYFSSQVRVRSSIPQ